MAAALQTREHALRTALENTTDSVMVVDRAWRCTTTSTRTPGRSCSHRESAGQGRSGEAFPQTADTPFFLALSGGDEARRADDVTGPSLIFCRAISPGPRLSLELTA